MFFQRVDKAFGTHYYEELCDLVDKEEQDDAQKEANTPPSTRGSVSPATSTSVTTVPSSVDSNPAVEKPLPPPPPPVEQTASSPIHVRDGAPATLKAGVIAMTDAIWAEIENGTRKSPFASRCEQNPPFKGIKDMTAEERAMVIGIHENNQFEWKAEAGELFEGAQSGFLSPAMCHIDPASAQVFEDLPPF